MREERAMSLYIELRINPLTPKRYFVPFTPYHRVTWKALRVTDWCRSFFSLQKRSGWISDPDAKVIDNIDYIEEVVDYKK